MGVSDGLSMRDDVFAQINLNIDSRLFLRVRLKNN